ncbi:MAG: GGDEF domain-containing protein [Gemmatimonadetes bacterium]|nr:GGDEF domain-containing protein [Gemmatimonadota bacterium]
MPLGQVRELLGFIGIVLQFGGAILVLALFLLLRPYAARRRYFRIWTKAWLALCAGIGAVFVRYIVLPSFGESPLQDGDALIRLLYVTYQFFKLLFFSLLVAGTVWYAKGFNVRRFVPYAVAGSIAWTILSVSLAFSLNGIVIWQCPAAAAALGYSAMTLLLLPPSRRTLGSTATGASFALVAVLWTLYFFAFSEAPAASGPPRTGTLGTVLDFAVHYNSYLDLLFQMLLGYGMVLMLLEDAKREVDGAHAELAVAHDELRRVALYDALTGTLNRRAFTEGVGLEVAKATFGTVAMIDVDNLKAVNDAHGHAAGDELLKRVADVLRSTLRASDKLYRWGGDEFLLVLPGAGAPDVQRRLETAIEQSPSLVLGDGGDRLPLQVSVGAAEYTGEEALQSAIGRADRAMYDEKARRKVGRAAEAPSLRPGATSTS